MMSAHLELRYLMGDCDIDTIFTKMWRYDSDMSTLSPFAIKPLILYVAEFRYDLCGRLHCRHSNA